MHDECYWLNNHPINYSTEQRHVDPRWREHGAKGDATPDMYDNVMLKLILVLYLSFFCFFESDTMS